MNYHVLAVYEAGSNGAITAISDPMTKDEAADKARADTDMAVAEFDPPQWTFSEEDQQGELGWPEQDVRMYFTVISEQLLTMLLNPIEEE